MGLRGYIPFTEDPYYEKPGPMSLQDRDWTDPQYSRFIPLPDAELPYYENPNFRGAQRVGDWNVPEYSRAIDFEEQGAEITAHGGGRDVGDLDVLSAYARSKSGVGWYL